MNNCHAEEGEIINNCHAVEGNALMYNCRAALCYTYISKSPSAWQLFIIHYTLFIIHYPTPSLKKSKASNISSLLRC